MSLRKSNIERGRKARPHYSPCKRTRHNVKILLQRELREIEAEA